MSDNSVCIFAGAVVLYKLWSVTGAASCRILKYCPQFILVCVKIFSLKSQSFQAKTPLKADHIVCTMSLPPCVVSAFELLVIDILGEQMLNR